MKTPYTFARAGLLALALGAFILGGARCSAEESCVPTTLQAAITNPDATTDDFFGNSVAVSGDRMIIGAPQEDPDGGVLNGGTAYLIDNISGATITLNKPQIGAQDNFGYSVGIDGNLAVVGAPFNPPGHGAAYVYDATTGALVSTLTNPAPDNQDWFGIAVAISGNLAVVGAPQDDPGGVSEAGTAYVFNATTGALVATLSNPFPASGDNFGLSVAISGDLTVVGAPNDNPGGFGNAGTAYVFDSETGSYLRTLDNPAPAGGDNFGNSVAISGNRVAVGAFLDDPGVFGDAGSVFIFDAPSGGLVTTLGNPVPTGSEYFGSSVSISGARVIVGAYGTSGAAGAAHIFDADTGALEATLAGQQLAGGDYFGYAVAISENHALVGALNGDTPSGISNAGAAWLYSCSSCPPAAQETIIDNPSPAVNDNFGFAVGVSGGLVVVGAPNDNPGGADNAGSAYVYNAETGAQVSTLANPTVSAGDLFGGAVAISGTRVIVGAPNDGGSNIGAAYLFNALTGALTATLADPAPVIGNDFFGFSVGISGNLAIVGSYGRKVGADFDAGRAYIYNAATGALLTTITEPGEEADQYFGYAVAIDGNLAAVTAPLDDTDAIREAGIAYVFNATTGALVSTLLNPTPGSQDYFGWSIAIAGELVVVGARDDNTPTKGLTGRAYVFNALTGAFVSSLDTPKVEGGDQFGLTVAISGTVAVVGAPLNYASFPVTTGTAFVFDALTGLPLADLVNPAAGVDMPFGTAVAISGNLAVVGAPRNDPGGIADAGNVVVFGCATPAPSPTPSETETTSPTPTETDTPTPTETETPTPSPTPNRREFGDFDSSGCTDLNDFLYLLDYWQTDPGDGMIGIQDFLALLDYWQTGPTC